MSYPAPLPVYEAIAPLWQSFLQEVINADRRRTALRQPQRVCFVGRFKAGKSRLINALVDTDILPYNTDECTSQMVELAFGGHAGAFKLTTLDLDTADEEPTLLEQFKRSLDLTTISGDEQKVLEESAYRCYLPHPILEITRLVDTPGFDGPTPETRERAKRLREQAIVQSDLCVLVVSKTLGGDDLDCAKMVRDLGGAMVVVLTRSDDYDSEALQDIRDHIVTNLSREIGVRPPFFACSALWQIGTEKNRAEIAAKRRFFDYEDESQWHQWGPLVTQLSRRRRGVERHILVLTNIYNTLMLAARLRDEFSQLRQAEFLFPTYRGRWERMMPPPLGPLVLEMSMKAAIGGTPLPWHRLLNFGITPELVAPESLNLKTYLLHLLTLYKGVLTEAVQIGLEDDPNTLFDRLTAEVSKFVILARENGWFARESLSSLEERVQELEWFSQPSHADFSYGRALKDLKIRWGDRPTAMDEDCSRIRARLVAALE